VSPATEGAFSAAEAAYLEGGERRLGRLATVGADGTPHVVPVGFSYNHAAGTIEVGGRAEAVTSPVPLIRIHPERVVSWGV
jgi:pyridoxamine 5'-phosphate oxidase family protein